MSARVSELARLLRSGGQTDEQLAAVLHDAHECDIAAALSTFSAAILVGP